MQDANPKQQIVEKLKTSTNILVTVGSNPSVDELSAALALALMLNRMDKHSTAVFSGATPPAISFLEPEKTFEDSVDSLRDFIIALDKEKADRLRYKVEDDVVRIFITPYKSVLSEKDLQFSQGDFNVELIVALGVEKREDLDAAITAHGRILHDATVVTMNINGAQSSLGALDWTDAEASSLSEMLVSVSEALQPGLLDQQIATALLTGIVAATDRFRNEKTSPKVMTMSAQLMAAGANQQLIAEKLEENNGLDGATTAPDGTKIMSEGSSSEKLKEDADQAKKPSDGTLEINHEVAPDEKPVAHEPGDEALKVAEAELAESLEKSTQDTSQPAVDLQQDLEQAHQEELASQDEPTTPEPSAGVVPAEAENTEKQPEQAIDSAAPQIVKEHRVWQTDNKVDSPRLGGTLNATVSDVEEARRRDENSAFNRPLLSHDAPGAVIDSSPTSVSPTSTDQNSTETSVQQAEAAVPALPSLPPLPTSEEPSAQEDTPLEQLHEDAMLNYEPVPVEGPSGPSLSQIDDETRGKAAEEARAAVDAVLDSMPFDPANQPLESAGATPAVSIDHQDVPATDQQSQPTPLSPVPDMNQPPTGVLPTPPPLPPLPDFSTLPPLPDGQVPPNQVPSQQPFVEATPQQQIAPPQPNDPGQFHIPGQ